MVYTDFSEYTTGQHPVGWTQRLDGRTWSVLEDPGVTGGKFVRDANATNALGLLTYDALDLAQDTDQYLRSGSSSTTSYQTGLVARGGLTSTGLFRGYVLRWTATALNLAVYYLQDNPEVFAETSAVTTIGTAPKTIAPLDLFWIRLKIVGNRLQGKLWHGAIEDEPGEWDIDLEDFRYGQAGWHGFQVTRGTGVRTYDVYSGEETPAVLAGSQLPHDYTEGHTFQALGGGTILSDGTRFATWREASQHVGSLGHAYGSISPDGRTWGATFLVNENLDYSSYAPMPAQAPDSSTILISYGLYDHEALDEFGQPAPAPILDGAKVLRCTDPEGPYTQLDTVTVQTGWNYVTAPPVPLGGGVWLLPTYGLDDGTTNMISAVSRSTDDGLTWQFLATIASGVIGPISNWMEPNICRITDGRLLCLIRTVTGAGSVYKSYSSDDGATWTVPVAAFTGIGPPALAQLPGGPIVTAYRSSDEPSNVGAYRTSRDGGDTWSAETLLFLGASWQHGQVTPLSASQLSLVYFQRAGSVLGGSAAIGFLRILDVGMFDISGTVAASAELTGTLTALGNMSGAAPATSAVTGVLTALANASGTVNAAANVSGDLSAYGNMTGAVAGSAALTGTLSVAPYELPAGHPRVARAGAESRMGVAGAESRLSVA